jgi:hypothetical protein
MRAIRFRQIAIAPAALLAAVVLTAPARADAQQAVREEGVAAPTLAQAARAAAAPVAPAAEGVRAHAPAVRVVAEYVVRHPRRAFPLAFTVADSAGRLQASYRVADAAQPREMTVTVRGADLVLRAETEEGPLVLVLEQQADAARAGRTLRGRWHFQGAEGLLQGRAQR